MEEFLNLYSANRNTFINNFYVISKKNNIDKVDESLRSLVKLTIPPYDGNITDYEYYKVHEFIVLTGIMAHHKMCSIDVPRLEAKNFGYEGCFKFLESYSTIVAGSYNKSDVQSEAQSNLLSVGRTEDYKSYIENAHYVEDIKNIIELIDKTERKIGANSKALTDLIAETFHSRIGSALSVIRRRYKYIMEGTFGVDNYVGVYTGKSVAVMQGVSKGHTKVINPDSTFSKLYKPLLDDVLNVTFYNERKEGTGRQFDLELIMSEVGERDYRSVKPIYFPLKMLEFISKCGVKTADGYTFTHQTQMLNYSRLSESEIGGLNRYLDAIEAFFKKDILSYLYLCLVSYCSSHFSEKYPEFRGNDKDLMESTLFDIIDEAENNIDNNLGWFDVETSIGNMLKYYVNCVTTVVVLDKCVVSKTKSSSDADMLEIADFRFKVCSKLTMPSYTNSEFIARLIQVQGINKSDMQGIDEYQGVVDEDGFTFIDLKYTFDADKVNARPIFAYKALLSLTNMLTEEERLSGKAPLGWDNILLGRGLSDELITSTAGSSINLQNSQVHFIMSGSRSGKGVMCYNIFATAIGSKKPIFYIDRKPDTATVLRAMSPNMFCVNGGQYDDTIDTEGRFNPTNYKFQIPSYLSNAFKSTEELFDYVYFRATLLILSMFDYADRFKSTQMGDALQQSFGHGAILVLDEFSNFIKDFLIDGMPFSVAGNSLLGSAYSSHGMIKGLQDISDTVTKAKTALAKTESKKNVTEAEISIAERNLAIAQSKVYDLSKVYMGAVADGYNSVLSGLAGKKDAAGAVAKTMQIFVIGQDFSNIRTAVDNATWFNTGAPTNTQKFTASQGINPLVKMLSGLSTDILTGYQKDRPSYLAQKKELGYKTANLLNASRRCFAYKNVGTLTTAELDKLMNTVDTLKSSDSVKNYLNTWTYFKPFLILNTADEPPEEVRYASFCPDSKVRENIRKGLPNDVITDANVMKACSKSQYVGQCLSQCENVGLTWDDLLEDNDDGSGHLHQGIGFSGYIQQLAGGIPYEAMNSSGDIVNKFIAEVYGYTGTWEEFLCDLRPEWIITAQGFDENGKSTVTSRLSSSFFNTGFVALDPVSILGDKLESLVPYYQSSGGNSTVQVADNNLLRTNEAYNDSYVEEPYESSYTSQATNVVSASSPSSNSAREESALEKLKRQESERESEAKAQAQSQLSDESLRNLVNALLVNIAGYDRLSNANKLVAFDKLFEYFRKAGV